MTPQQPGFNSTPATVQSFRVGARHYELRYNDCGKANCNKCGGVGKRHPSHGPYWYLCVISKGAWRRIYLGKELDTTRFVGPDGKVDWKAVKTKRSLKNYQELTNHETPGQLSCIPETHDRADDVTSDQAEDLPAPKIHTNPLEEQGIASREVYATERKNFNRAPIGRATATPHPGGGVDLTLHPIPKTRDSDLPRRRGFCTPGGKSV